MMTTEQELLSEQILDIIDNVVGEVSRGDLQGIVEALAMKYQLKEDK